MLTKTVETPEEGRGTELLDPQTGAEYDDVMNEPARSYTKYRRRDLRGRDSPRTPADETEGVIERLVRRYTAGDLLEDGIWASWRRDAADRAVRHDVATLAPETRFPTASSCNDALDDDAMSAYETASSSGPRVMRATSSARSCAGDRHPLARTLSTWTTWRGHHLSGFAQIDPLVATKKRALDVLELMHSIWTSSANWFPHRDRSPGRQRRRDQRRQPRTELGLLRRHRRAPALGAGTGRGRRRRRHRGRYAPPNPSGDVVEDRGVKDEHDKVGRTDPCWCGSAKKYKKCHGA